MSKANTFINPSDNHTADQSIRASRAQRGLIDSLGYFKRKRGDGLAVKRGAQERRAGTPGAPRLPGCAGVGVRGAWGAPGGSPLADSAGGALQCGGRSTPPACEQAGGVAGAGRGAPPIGRLAPPRPTPRHKAAAVTMPPAKLSTPHSAPLDPHAARAHHGLHSAAGRKMALSGEQRL